MKTLVSLAIQIWPNEDFDQTAENAQVDLNPRWAHMSEGTFSDVAIHFILSHLRPAKTHISLRINTLRVIKLCSSSTQLSMKFSQLIKMKCQ